MWEPRPLTPLYVMTTFYCLRFETPPTWRTRSAYLYPTGTGWPSYTPRHWVPFPSPFSTRRATVEVFDCATTRATKLIASIVFLITIFHWQNRKHSFQQHPSCCRRVFTDPLLINGLHDIVVLLLRACMLQALLSNGRCLQSHRLTTGLYATEFNGVYLSIVIIYSKGTVCLS
jgi:hypothetical protein